MQTFNILSEELLKKGKETKYLNCPDSMLNIGISTWTPQSTFESQLKHSTVRLVIFTLQKLRTMYQSFLLIHLCKITRMNVLLLSINHSIISLSLRCLFFFFVATINCFIIALKPPEHLRRIGEGQKNATVLICFTREVVFWWVSQMQYL